MDNISNIVNSNLYNQSVSNAKNANLSNKVSKLSNQSTEEELTDAVKSFESYFVEQVLKEMEKSAKMLSDDEDDNSSMSMMKDIHMDGMYQQMASTLVDKAGSRFTESMVNQMKRTYGIKDDADRTNTD
jgi:flagellar protein FlgJ